MKKILALLLVAVMVVALFAACNSTQTDDPTTIPTTAPTEPTNNTPETPYPVDENGNFVYGDAFKGVTVKIVAIATEEQDDLWLWKQIEEKFGCNVEVIEIESGSYKDKMAALLADKNLPTIFDYFTPVAQVVEYGEQGAFVDVMDPENLAKMPNFAKIFADDKSINELYLQTGAEDGSHYILPNYDCERAVNHYWIYNETAFKKAGVEWSGDTKNGGFLQMLRDLKAYYPDSYPLTGGAWQSTLDRMAYTWSVNSSYAAYDWDKGEWYFGATTDAYYDMLNLLLTAYNEKLMNPDILTQGNGAIQNNMANHQSFLYNSWLGWMTTHNGAYAGKVDDHEVPAPTPVGPNGKTLELSKWSNQGGKIINAEDPKAAECAMAIMNWMYDISENGGAWVNTVGPEEVLEKDENGRYNWVDGDKYNNDVNYVGEKYGMYASILAVRYCPESPYFTFNAEEQAAQDIGDKIGFFPAPPSMAISDTDIADAYTNAQKEIQAMTQKFIVENWDRAKFDAWVADFNATYGEVMEYLNG